MSLLDLLRWCALFVWLIALLMASPPFARYMAGRGIGDDDWWAQLWQVSALLSAWGIRNVTIGPSLHGDNYGITCGLLVLQCLVGGAVVRRRINRNGWRW